VAVPENSLTVGLFGGTFDPVHQGHLDLARHVLDRCRLDQLLFIPAPLPPHKRQPVASFTDRTAMLVAALAECPDTRGRVRCSRIEEHLPTPSYTINTVQALLAQERSNQYCLIIGADSLLDLPHWHRIDELLGLVNLIVVKRETIDLVQIGRALAALAPDLFFDADRMRWFGPEGRTVDYLGDIELPVSSSAIREELRQGRVPPMLPPAVFAYIRQHRLYSWREPV
jgi:nicotinate-nucleotide adenylyltransferase